MSFLPDHSALALIFDTGMIVVMDLDSGAERQRIDLGQPWPKAQIGESGEWLAVSREGETELWKFDSDSGEFKKTEPSLSFEVGDLPFREYGQRIVDADPHSAVILRDFQTGKPVGVVGPNRGVGAVDLGSSGERLALFSYDKSIQIWSIPEDTTAIIRDAKSNLRKCLSPEQRERFFLAPDAPAWCDEVE